MTAKGERSLRKIHDRYPSRIAGEPALTDRLDPVVYGGPGDGPLTREQCKAFERDGFLVIPELVTADEVESCLRELDRTRKEADTNDPAVVTEPGSGEVRSIFAVHETNRVLVDLLRTPRLLAKLIESRGIVSSTGPAGTVTFFDCNIMHGSSSNISPWPRTNLFAVYNSVDNAIGEPYADVPPRPQVIANRQDFSPAEPS